MDKYSILRKLGQGTYGSVYLCEQKDTGRQCVMKRMLLRNLSEKERNSALQEAQLLESLNHPNIVAYVDTVYTRSKLYLLMQYCDGGDLERKLNEVRKENGMVPETQLLDWFVQMALALQYLHSKRILHRDLKTANVFLTAIGIVKLGDFGVSRVLSATSELAKTFVGTPYYLSPELLNNSPYGHASDVWCADLLLSRLGFSHALAFLVVLLGLRNAPSF
jgi:NIMA (never in mitosis gene a)-related kinase